MATAKKTKTLARSTVSPEQVKKVIELIESGISERAACREVGVNRMTFRTTALKSNVEDQYARALEALAADQIEKMEQTIEDMRKGVVDSNMARVELDTRKWFASKLLPKRYGDKLDMTSDGKALPQPILAMLTTKNAENDRKVITNDVIDAEVSDETSTRPQISAPENSGNIMDDINQ